MRTTFIARTIKSLRCVIAGLIGDDIDSVDSKLRSTPVTFDFKSTLRQILGVERLIDCVEQRPADYDCPIYFVRDDYLARKQAGFPIPSELDKLLPHLDNLSSQELLHEILGKRKDWETNVHIIFNDISPLFSPI
ncbi:unnamed protein product [Heterobilharzia americana]|nr:unnamed protein product [Heterobilharzia americana]